MRAYLDASVLIAYLYGERHAPERFVPTRQLFTAIEEQRLEAVVSFYALQELHAFIKPSSKTGGFLPMLTRPFGLPYWNWYACP